MEKLKTKGRVTLPVEEHHDEELKSLITQWGADAVRNSDGTQLSKALGEYVEKVYATFFPVRQDLAWAQAHPEQLQEMYLMSAPRNAESDTLTIRLLDSFFEEQLKVDITHDPKRWWEVIDRTTGETVSLDSWEYTGDTVTIHGCTPWHSYTVSFLAWQTWDPTHMYNHITNNWGDDVPHSLPYNPAKPEAHDRMLEFFTQWLGENPQPNVIRFTTFFYHFCLFFGSNRKEKFVDWFGYGQSVSPEMLDAFAREKGYRLRPEDLVDAGYYNNAFRVPSRAYLDYMDFVQQFVAKTAKELVDICHAHGREAMMFLGDNYIGTEPYGKYFGSIGIDAVVGSVGSGSTMRMIADIPHVSYTEGRFLPYFFPDTFCEGGDPVGEANNNWLQARRAMLRNSVDRIGYGGYPSLALQFPDFIARVTEICDEFRTMYDNIAKSKPYTTPGKVAILNCWGSLRSWQTHMVAHALLFKQTETYMGVLEALSGMAVDVAFLSFDDIRGGVPEDVSVLINVGQEGTAFSGGALWADAEVVSSVRAWVHAGGGFIGVGEPTAYQHGGRFFQLADVLGVDKEVCFTLNHTKYNPPAAETHFITADVQGEPELGEYCDNVYAYSAENLVLKNGCTQVAANTFGAGRAVYLAGLPYSAQNTRLLLRSICWASNNEDALHKWFTTNSATECSYYPARGKLAVVNNTDAAQETVVHRGDGTSFALSLAPMELKWFDA